MSRSEKFAWLRNDCGLREKVKGFGPGPTLCRRPQSDHLQIKLQTKVAPSSLMVFLTP